MILAISAILVVMFTGIALFSRSYKMPIVFFIIFSPIIAASWNIRFDNLSLIHLFGILFILIYLIRFLAKRESLIRLPFANIFIIYLCILIFVSVNVYLNSSLISALDFFIKSLFFPLSFYLFYYYFSTRSNGKLVTLAFLVAGIFPLFFILVQRVTGNVWYYRETRGLVRNVGLYHDNVMPRIFLIQILIGLMLFWHYYSGRKNITQRIFFLIIGVLSILGLFFLYSKAILVTLTLWIIMYSILRLKLHIIPFALAVLLFANFVTDNRIYSEVQQVFSKEIAYSEGELESRYVLSGRGWIWGNYIEEWVDFSIVKKLIGSGRSHGYFHNDFLRILFTGGILLLSFYIFLFIILLWSVIRKYLAQRSFIHFAALLSLVYLFIESIGQVPGLYPNIQIFVWGLVGLSLNSRFDWADTSKQPNLTQNNEIDQASSIANINYS